MNRAALAIGAGAAVGAAAVDVGLVEVLGGVGAAGVHAEAADAGVACAIGSGDAGLARIEAGCAVVGAAVAVVIEAVAGLGLEGEDAAREGEVGAVAVEDPGALGEAGRGGRGAGRDVAVADDAEARGEALGGYTRVAVADGVAEQRGDAGELGVGAAERERGVEGADSNVGAKLGDASRGVAAVVEPDVVGDELDRLGGAGAGHAVLDDGGKADALLDATHDIGVKAALVELADREGHLAGGGVGGAGEVVGKPEAVGRSRDAGVGRRQRGAGACIGRLERRRSIRGAGSEQEQRAREDCTERLELNHLRLR